MTCRLASIGYGVVRRGNMAGRKTCHIAGWVNTRWYSVPNDQLIRDKKFQDVIESRNQIQNSVIQPPPIQELGETSSGEDWSLADQKERISTKETTLITQKNESIKRYLGQLVDFQRQNAEEKLLIASRMLNDLTGYSIIENLKLDIERMEGELKESKMVVKTKKKSYLDAIHQRSQSQKEINELLTRRNSWSSTDLERFTELYKNDHLNEQNELTAQESLTDAESQIDAIQLKLFQKILFRYHEEQVWSDKIRRVSTWGTCLLMGINILMFISATFIVEPWKREKLVGTFEDKIKEVLRRLPELEKPHPKPIETELEPFSMHSFLTKIKESSASDTMSHLKSLWLNIKASCTKFYTTLTTTSPTNFTQFDVGVLAVATSIAFYGLGILSRA